MYHIFLIHSSIDGHTGCFHILTTVNKSQFVKVKHNRDRVEETLHATQGSCLPRDLK